MKKKKLKLEAFKSNLIENKNIVAGIGGPVRQIIDCGTLTNQAGSTRGDWDDEGCCG